MNWDEMRKAKEFFKENSPDDNGDLLLTLLIDYARDLERAIYIDRDKTRAESAEINMVAIKSILSDRLNTKKER